MIAHEYFNIKLPAVWQIPNGDGINDCFRIIGWGIVEDLDFQIYNRWSQLVFHSVQPRACWDGTYKGQNQPEGVYVYLITAKTNCGLVTKKGSFLLIR